MTVITEHEQEQIATANASGLAPVAFVHGLWRRPGSGDRWACVFGGSGPRAGPRRSWAARPATTGPGR